MKISHTLRQWFVPLLWQGLVLLGCFGLARMVTGADPAEIPTVDVSMDSTGRFSVAFDSDPSLYYQLSRYGEPASRRVLAMVRSGGERIVMRDPVLPRGDGLYRVEAMAAGRETIADYDRDGLSDVAELADYPRSNPLNPASAIELKQGATLISSREMFESLARRDDVPGARDIREVKFLIRDVHTDRPNLYFFNTNAHPYHFFFARDVLKYTAGLELVLEQHATVDEVSETGANQIIIAQLDEGLYFRVFDSVGNLYVDLAEDQLRSSKKSLVVTLKSDLEPYWDTGIPSVEEETELILWLNIIIENFLLTPFNAETYFSNVQRKNLAGSLLSYDSYLSTDGRQGIYTIEYWPTDPVEFKFVEKASHLINVSLPFIRSQLAYHPASETQRSLFARQRADFDASFVRTIHTEELFGNVTFTPMNLGVGFGRLRVANAGETLSARDVVIFRSLPNDLPHVAGILTEISQTPLSHVNLKAIQNNTPNAYLADAASHSDIAPLIGRNVRYEVTADGFSVREATQAEVETFLEDLRPDEEQFPTRNLSKQTILPFEDLVLADSDAYGAKSANLAELRRMLPPAMTPDGFGVPFHFYDAFMTGNGFYDVAREMIEEETFKSDPAVREERLKDFRKTIRDGIAPQWMFDALQELHDSFPQGTSLRCRSSTNNEDLPEFNGAGLYESFTHHLDEGHLIKSMKQVWAGLWTYRAFEERDFYRIDHFTAAMGVVVHPNFGGELANGVAVTRNIVNPDWPGSYVNVQVGEDLVTNPNEESIPEEFLIAQLDPDNWGTYEIQYVRFSNRIPEDETVLTTEQAEDLARRLVTVRTRFRTLYRESFDFAMEVEFKITAEGQLVIKQARPWVD